MESIQSLRPETDYERWLREQDKDYDYDHRLSEKPVYEEEEEMENPSSQAIHIHPPLPLLSDGFEHGVNERVTLYD
ncbi:hypothetical protein BJX70DRAFT_399957 [Aspergillus crustosus]